MTNNSSQYWIASNSINISLNAQGDPNLIQASVVNGAVIVCYIPDLSDDNTGHNTLGYDNSHNYRRWNIQAHPTLLGDASPKFTYIAIPKDKLLDNGTYEVGDALLTFPSEELDINGQNSGGSQIGNTNYYYINIGGKISATNEPDPTTGLSTTERTWLQSVDLGKLNTDEYLNGGESPWYNYSATNGVVTFLKQVIFSVASIIKAAELWFGEKKITAIADAEVLGDDSSEHIVTPAFLKAFGNIHYLHKDIEDTASEKIKFAKGADFGSFNTGLTGSHISNNGTAEFGAVTIRESLTVPKLVYNRTEVQAGNVWRTVGGGEIESVITNNDGTGVITLKLEEGEIGMVAAGDICQGVYHLSSGNDTTNTDGRNGNFTFAGFKTIYFEVLEILKTDDNSKFSYRLRSVSDDAWSDSTHPQPYMNFAVYGNRTNAQRQSSALDTTQYHLLLAGVTSWNFTSTNIQYIEGYLTGFNIDCRYWDKTSQQWVTGTKTLSGYGLAFGKAYMWGNIEQFDRQPSLVSQQIKYLASVYSSGVTPLSEGWTNEPQTATKEKPYLWQYYVQTFSDNTTKNTSPFIAANFAADGSSVEIYGSYPTETALRTAYASRELSAGRGHGYTVQDTGHLWVFTTDTYSGVFNNDMQDVGQIKGDKGDAGDKALAIDLTNQMSSVPMDKNGRVLSAITINTTVNMLYGVLPQTLTNIETTASSASLNITKDISTGGIAVTIPQNTQFTNDRAYVTVIATCAKGSLSTIFNIVGVRQGNDGINGVTPVLYSLAPADPFVKIDKNGAYSATSLFCFVNKQEGNDITTHVDYGTIKVVLDEIEDDFLFDDGDSLLYDDDTVLGGVTMYDYNPDTGFIIGSTYNPTKCVKFILYSPDGILLDVENVPVVIDGEDDISVELYTNNGNIIRNGEGSVTIYARVLRGEKTDITNEISQYNFAWSRESGNAEADAEWNALHRGIHATKSITVSKSEIYNKAQFTCDVSI